LASEYLSAGAGGGVSRTLAKQRRIMGVLVVVIIFVVVAVPLAVYRMRKGGPGPGVNWIPKSMRGKTNEVYEEHGWQEPYDAQGEKRS
jgi:mannose/fructose/N-acetylgalactosamine-specific phosphotransferase system component IID